MGFDLSEFNDYIGGGETRDLIAYEARKNMVELFLTGHELDGVEGER
jgi:hypothetical protein